MTNASSVNQALKIFLKKNPKFMDLVVIGEEEAMSTIKDINHIETIVINDETKAIQKANELSKEKDTKVLFFQDVLKVTEELSSLTITKTKTKNLVQAVKFPLLELAQTILLTSPLTESTNKYKDIKITINLVQDYLTKHGKSKERKYKILLPVNKVLDEEKMNEVINNDPNFVGYITLNEILNPNCDFVVCNKDMLDFFLEGFKFAFETSGILYNNEVSRNVTTKIGNKFIRAAKETIEMRLDKKTRSFGTIVLGLDQTLIFGTDNKSTNSILRLLDTTKF